MLSVAQERLKISVALLVGRRGHLFNTGIARIRDWDRLYATLMRIHNRATRSETRVITNGYA
jgi:hypothetical protein